MVYRIDVWKLIFDFATVCASVILMIVAILGLAQSCLALAFANTVLRIYTCLRSQILRTIYNMAKRKAQRDLKSINMQRKIQAKKELAMAYYKNLGAGKTPMQEDGSGRVLPVLNGAAQNSDDSDLVHRNSSPSHASRLRAEVLQYRQSTPNQVSIGFLDDADAHQARLPGGSRVGVDFAAPPLRPQPPRSMLRAGPRTSTHEVFSSDPSGTRSPNHSRPSTPQRILPQYRSPRTSSHMQGGRIVEDMPRPSTVGMSQSRMARPPTSQPSGGVETRKFRISNTSSGDMPGTNRTHLPLLGPLNVGLSTAYNRNRDSLLMSADDMPFHRAQ